MLPVQLSTGEVVSFADLYRDPVALVFLRHLGCLFCRQHVAELSSRPELNVVFVTMSPPEETEAFRRAMHSPHRFVCDPERKLHGEFGIATARLGQVIGPRVLLKTAGAIKHGFAKPTSDPLSLGATVVLDREGQTTWTHRAKDVADNATPDQIRDALRLSEG